MTTKAKKVEEVTEVIETPVNFTEGHTLESFMDSEKGRELGYKAAQKYWKDNGAKTKVTGFRAKFYAELAKGKMTDSEVLEFAKSNGGSDNDIKQISHFYAIAELASEIRKSLEVKPEVKK